MATLMMIVGIALTALCAGLLSGAVLWHRHMNKQQVPPPQPPPRITTTPGPLLWDVHSLLNTMSRFAMAAERGAPLNPAFVYCLSDYLLQSSLLQRQGGWTDAQTLENWLQAHLAILVELRAQSTPPRIRVRFFERIQHIDANTVIRQLHWLLQRAHTIESIEVHAAQQEASLIAAVTVNVFGTMDHIDHPPSQHPATAWHLDTGRCTFELSADCDSEAATEASPA